MILKKCNTCNKEKKLNLFPSDPKKREGVGNKCNECRQKHPTVLSKVCQECNKIFNVTGKRKLTKYCSKECVKTKNKRHKQQYELNNREKINSYVRSYRSGLKNDPLLRFKNSISQRVREAFRKKYWRKHGKTQDILGCTFLEFKNHINQYKEEWMTDDNYGLYNGQKKFGWDLDHIVPLSSAKTEEELIRLCHFTNIKPLCSYENRVIKRDSYGKLPTEK